MLTTPMGPEFVKNTDPSGAKSSDHTHRAMVRAESPVSPSARRAAFPPYAGSRWTAMKSSTSFLVTSMGSLPIVVKKTFR